MKEFFTKNRFQVTVLIAVLLFVLIIGVGVFIAQNDPAQKKKNEQNETTATDPSSEEDSEDTDAETQGQVSSMSTTRDVTEALTDALEDAGQIEVGNNTQLPKYYSYTIRPTDSQTRGARKIIAEFSKSYRKLENWERTYLETTIVNELGRKEKVNPGEQVVITYEMLTNHAQRLASLDASARQKWETFSHNTIFFDSYDGVEII